MKVLDRFMVKVEMGAPGGCWLWRGGVGNSGYGVFWMNGVNLGAHRASYILNGGEIPPGLVIDHLCRNRGCVNPDHLEVVTQSENVLRGVRGIRVGPPNRKRKTHCKRGHEFTPENTYTQPRGVGMYSRACRACTITAATKRYHNQKAETPNRGGD